MTKCHECNDTGARDSGGTHPWGEPVLLPCDCKDAEIGRRWREDSSLEKWFPITAERLAALEAENAALKREAHTWSKAAETYAADAERFRWLAEHTVATGLARWVHPFQFLAEAVDARRNEATTNAAPRVTTAAELRQQAKSDTSCVGAFARARPGKA